MYYIHLKGVQEQKTALTFNQTVLQTFLSHEILNLSDLLVCNLFKFLILIERMF